MIENDHLLTIIKMGSFSNTLIIMILDRYIEACGTLYVLVEFPFCNHKVEAKLAINIITKLNN